MSANFYTYFHTRNDSGATFYVGKGKGSRAESHLSRSAHWKNIVAKCGFTVNFALTDVSEEEAFDCEKFLIASFKSLGLKLVNMTNGGDGVRGFKPTPAQNEANRQRALQQMSDPAHIKKISETAKARFQQDDVRNAAFLRLQKLRECEDHRSKLSDAAKARWQKKDEREKQALRSSRYASDPDVRARLKAQSTGVVQSEETIAKIKLALTGKPRSEQTKMNMRAAWVFRKSKDKQPQAHASI